ncbi:MAG: alkaline phosphatase family protein [Vicinamibacterales bacterium]
MKAGMDGASRRWTGWVAAALVAVAAGLAAAAGQTPPARLHLVIVVDGLRPDQVTAEVMPHLHALAARGVRFTRHHSVFPTVTRVNAATFVTGVLPARHGLLGNSIYIPSADPVRPIDTADHEALLKVAAAEGRLLTAPTLGQMLAGAGKRLLVVSSGSSGSALLLSPTDDAGVILHTQFARPESWRARSVALLGPTPPAGLPNAARNRYATDLLLRLGLPEVRPDVVFLWYSDPDTTAHARGLDAAETRAALTAVDGEIGRVEDWLRDQGRLAATNLVVTSDHGFATYTGGFDLPALVKPFVRPMADGTPDIVVAGGAIHFRVPPEDARVRAVVEALQRAPAVGAIFMASPLPAGRSPAAAVPGTLSHDLVGWGHPRAAQLLASPAWTDAVAAGMRGTSSANGTAGHGSTSPFEVTNTLLAAGPDFRERVVSDVATGNVDITPTLLRLAGVAAPASAFDGRVIAEALRGDAGSGPRAAVGGAAGGIVTRVPAPFGYQAEARVTEVSGVRYFDSATATRRPPP